MSPSLSSTANTRTRAIITEMECASVNALARETDLPVSTAADLRRLFLLERVAHLPLCVEVDGSAFHTKAGDPGAPSPDAPALIEAVEEDEPLDADDGEDANDEDAPEVAGVGLKQYTYLGDGITAAVHAGYVVPTTKPFRRSKYTDRMFRYVRLTATGRELADKYVTHEARQRDARALPSLDTVVKEGVRTGALKVTNRRAV